MACHLWTRNPFALGNGLDGRKNDLSCHLHIGTSSREKKWTSCTLSHNTHVRRPALKKLCSVMTRYNAFSSHRELSSNLSALLEIREMLLKSLLLASLSEICAEGGRCEEI